MYKYDMNKIMDYILIMNNGNKLYQYKLKL